MDVPLLRRMTRKSTMGFGQYGDNSVQDLLTFYKFRYLRWVYFNCSKITFTDDILEELNIPESFRIEKPGKCPEKCQKLTDALSDNRRGLSKHIAEKISKKIARGKRVASRRKERARFSKGKLQSINQGRKK